MPTHRRSELLHTPMGCGLIAAATETAAHSLAETWHGSILTFNDLLEGDVAMHSH